MMRWCSLSRVLAVKRLGYARQIATDDKEIGDHLHSFWEIQTSCMFTCVSILSSEWKLGLLLKENIGPINILHTPFYIWHTLFGYVSIWIFHSNAHHGICNRLFESNFTLHVQVFISRIHHPVVIFLLHTSSYHKEVVHTILMSLSLSLSYIPVPNKRKWSVGMS